MDPSNTRRWPRHQVDLPVRIACDDGTAEITVPGLATEISRAGVAVYAGIDRRPGDLIEIVFQAPGQPHMVGVVRNRTGFCFGLAFVALLDPDGPEAGSLVLPDQLVPVVDGHDQLSLILQRHAAFLRQKQAEIGRAQAELLKIRELQGEVEILQNVAIQESLRRADSVFAFDHEAGESTPSSNFPGKGAKSY